MPLYIPASVPANAFTAVLFGDERFSPSIDQPAPMFVRGASFDIVPGVWTTPGSTWLEQLAAMKFVTSYTTSALTATRYIEQAGALIGGAFSGIPASALWPASTAGKYNFGVSQGSNPGQPGVQVLGCNTNDYTNSTADRANTPGALTSNQVNAVLASLFTCLAIMSSGTRFEEPSSAANWTQQASTATMNYSGGDVLYTTTPGASVNVTVTVPASGTLYHLTYVLDPALAATGDITYSVGGTVVGIYRGSQANCGTLYSANASSPAGAGYYLFPVMVPLTGLTPGAQTITVTKRDASATATVYCDAFFSPLAVPPPIVIHDTPPLNPSCTTPPYTAPQYATFNANLLLRPLLAAVAAQFPNAIWVPLSQVLSPTGSDQSAAEGTHPNDSGQRKIALATMAALSAWAANSNTAGMYPTT